MDDETDAAREYDRLRAELAGFVMDALAQQVAEGQQPQLSQALIDAIDRRVDEAVSERLSKAEWPDPDVFANAVIAAAAGRGGGGDGERIGAGASRARRNGEGRSTYRDPPERERRIGAGGWALIALVGLAVMAAAIFLLPRLWSGATNTVVVNASDVSTNTMQPAPVDPANVQQPLVNGAAPTSAGADVNAVRPNP